MSNWDTIVEPVRVLGLTLRSPITLAHVMLLDELASPIVRNGDVMIGDVALAAFVCAHPAGDSKRKLRQWSTRLAFKLWARLWKPSADDANRFHSWFSDQIALPEMWKQQSRGRQPELAAPWWVNRITLAMNAGLSFYDATELPLRVVNLLIASKLESSGVCEFVSQRQKEYFTQVDEWMRQGIGRN